MTNHYRPHSTTPKPTSTSSPTRPTRPSLRGSSRECRCRCRGMRPYTSIKYVRRRTERATDLHGGEPHELSGRWFPDGGHGDDPAYVVVRQRRRRLVAEFLQRVMAEVAQRMREHVQCPVRLAVSRHDHRVAAQPLQPWIYYACLIRRKFLAKRSNIARVSRVSTKNSKDCRRMHSSLRALGRRTVGSALIWRHTRTFHYISSP